MPWLMVKLADGSEANVHVCQRGKRTPRCATCGGAWRDTDGRPAQCPDCGDAAKPCATCGGTGTVHHQMAAYDCPDLRRPAMSATKRAVKILGAWCPECGPVKYVDEDGLCRSCGSTCTGWGANLAIKNAKRCEELERRIRLARPAWRRLAMADALDGDELRLAEALLDLRKPLPRARKAKVRR